MKRKVVQAGSEERTSPNEPVHSQTRGATSDPSARTREVRELTPGFMVMATARGEVGQEALAIWIRQRLRTLA
jgi:hypothetical protein